MFVSPTYLSPSFPVCLSPSPLSPSHSFTHSLTHRRRFFCCRTCMQLTHGTTDSVCTLLASLPLPPPPLALALALPCHSLTHSLSLPHSLV